MNKTSLIDVWYQSEYLNNLANKNQFSNYSFHSA